MATESSVQTSGWVAKGTDCERKIMSLLIDVAVYSAIQNSGGGREISGTPLEKEISLAYAEREGRPLESLQGRIGIGTEGEPTGWAYGIFVKVWGRPINSGRVIEAFAEVFHQHGLGVYRGDGGGIFVVERGEYPQVHEIYCRGTGDNRSCVVYSDTNFCGLFVGDDGKPVWDPNSRNLEGDPHVVPFTGPMIPEYELPWYAI